MEDKGSIDIREIIKKTGHSLEEIRIRALDNILSKLRNGIICIEDLIHHRELFVNLLQWFNHENPAKIGQVLKLLEALSKYGAAVSIIQSLGGVEFFSKFRQDVSYKENLQSVDAILDSIFWLYAEEEKSRMCEDENAKEMLYHNASKPVGKPHKRNEQSIEASSRHPKAERSKEPVTDSKELSWSSEKAMRQNDIRDMLAGGTENARNQDIMECTVKGKPAKGTFKAEWIVLTSSDRHILSVTESRLQSHSTDLVWQSCEFFRDVLLQDFPTHIFIQRPNIVKTLLSLLELHSRKDGEISSILIGCLNDLTINLAKSSLQQMSPDLSQISKMKESYSSTASSVHTELSSLNSRTTSFNGEGTSMHSGNTVGQDSQPNVEGDPGDFEGTVLTEALQQSQWSAIDYCLALTSSIISFIKTSIEGGRQCEGAMLLLSNVLPLLGLYDVKSCWNSNNGERKVYDVMACLRHFSSLVQLCLETKQRILSQTWNSLDVETVFVLLGNVAAISIQFTNLSVPNDKLYEALPDSLLSSFKAIFADEVFAVIYPSIRVSLHGILKVTEEMFYHNFQNACNVVSSMKAVANFLKEMKKMDANSERALLKRVELCTSSIHSVGFHHYQPFIRSALDLVSCVFSIASPSVDLASKAANILMRLLSHEKDQVRLLAYDYSLEIATDALSESHVTNPLSLSYQKALFLINADVLLEIASFGIESTNQKISNYAVNIVVTLLLGRLNMSSQAWQSLIFAIIPVLPFLQCFAGIDRAFGRALASISDSSHDLIASDGETYSLPPLEQLRASFRFMFVKDASVRAKGFSSLIWTLTQEDNKLGRPVRYPHENIQSASDMFLVPPTVTCRYESGITEHKSFTNLDQLWDVFHAESVDPPLKVSAAEQLSLLVQDINLQKQLLDHNAEKSVVNTLREYTRQLNTYGTASMNNNLKMILSCVTILRYLVQYNALLRHTLAVDRNLLLDILRCRIAYHDNEAIHYETSCLVLFIIFDEVFSKTGNEVVVPILIAKRYSLPLHLKTRDMTTVHREKFAGTAKENLDELEDEPLLSMIRISWNVILTEEDMSEGHNLVDSNQFLSLTTTEVKLLKDFNGISAIKRHLDTLKISESEEALVTAMNDLKKHVMSCVCRLCRRDVVDELIRCFSSPDVLKRILTSVAPKHKTSILGDFISLCQLFTLIESEQSSVLSREALMILLAAKGAVSQAVSNYTNSRAQDADLPRVKSEAYDLTNESRSLFKNILLLSSSLCIEINSDDKILNYDGFDHVGDFLLLILQTLNKVDSTRYYDLPVLEVTLDCLCHVTYKRGWSLQYHGNGEELCNFMASIFIQILHSFHIDRIGASTSFMGKGVTAKVAMSLCHVAMENQAYCGHKDWTANWVSRNPMQSSDDLDNDLPWLLPLLTDRILDIRWAGWSLSTALLNGVVGAESVVREFQVFPGGVWASAVSVILDVLENPLVRTQACQLISVSLSKLKRSGQQSNGQSLWESMVVQDTQTQENISGVQAFILLLDHFNFFAKIKEQLKLESLDSLNGPSMTSLQNVSTSCSTPASDVDQLYQNISGKAKGHVSTEGSDSAVDSKFASERGSLVGEGSSSECLLLSSADSLDSNASQGCRPFYRLSAEKQIIRAGKEVNSTMHHHPKYPTSKLKSAIFLLISKLLEVDVKNVIASLEAESFLDVLIQCLDPDFVVIYLTASSKNLSKTNARGFKEKAEMTTNLLILVNSIAVEQETALQKLNEDEHFSSHLTLLFRLPQNALSCYASINKHIFNLWNEALRLLIKMCNSGSSLARTRAEEEIVSCFHVIAVSYFYATSIKDIAEPTKGLFLLLYKALFCREGRRSMTDRVLADVLDSPCRKLDAYKPQKNDAWGVIGSQLTLGEYLCNLLLNQMSMFHVAVPGRKVVVSSLATLFVISNSSKLKAIDSGFLEAVIEDMKDIHVKLNLASLQINRDENQNKKERALLAELCNIFDLLRSLTHSNSEVKTASARSGLPASIHKMWSWCMIDKSLKSSVLQFLTTVTANCTRAQEMVCRDGLANSNKVTNDDHTLFHSIMKLLVKLHKDSMAPTGKIESSLKVTFYLLTNLAVLAESRSLIWKCNFLQYFKSSQVGQSANRKQKTASRILTALWAQFLLVLSFFVDGTNAILKADGMLPTLIAFGLEESHRERAKALLILRNLLAFPANKPVLVTNDKVIGCLLKAIDIKSIWSKSIVVSCFATLLHNCHKAKVTLKKTKLLGKLQLLHEDILSGKILCIDGNVKGYDQLKSSMKVAIASLSS